MLSLGGVRAASPGDFGTLVTGWHPEDAVLSGADVTSWPSRWGSSYTLSVADAPQYSVTGWAGTAPAILCDGTNDGLYHDTLAQSWPAGDDVPWYAVMAVDVVSVVGGGVLAAFGDAVSTTASRHLFNVQVADPTRWSSTRVSDSVASASVASAAGATSTGRRIVSIEYSGTALTVRMDGVVVSGMSAAAQNVSTCAGMDTFGLGVFRRAGAGANYGNYRFGPVLLYSALPDEAGARAYLHSLGYAP